MQSFVKEFTYQYQKGETLKNAYEKANEMLETNMMDNEQEFPFNPVILGLNDENREPQIDGQILDNRIMLNKTVGLKSNKDSYLFYDNSYHLFSQIIFKCLKNDDHDILIKGN